jgi:hypothetical protein
VIGLASLNEQLAQINAQLAQKLPEEFRKAAAKTVQGLMTNESVQGLPVGEQAPEFTLPDATGKQVAFSDVLDQGPVVLSFYRGSW